MSWAKSITGYRRVETRRGDSLEAVAMRELGDASRWHELAHLNGLAPPYLTDDPEAAGAQVLLTGQLLMLPAAAPPPSGVVDGESIFGRDIALPGGLLEVNEAGDLAVVAGVPNLRQALEHRLVTRPSELIYHPAYGCPVWHLIGRGATPAVNQLASAFVDRTLRADPRIQRTDGSLAQLAGDAVRVESTAVTVDGKKVPVGIGRK